MSGLAATLNSFLRALSIVESVFRKIILYKLSFWAIVARYPEEIISGESEKSRMVNRGISGLMIIMFSASQTRL